jgi:hypothetical protein
MGFSLHSTTVPFAERAEVDWETRRKNIEKGGGEAAESIEGQ